MKSHLHYIIYIYSFDIYTSIEKKFKCSIQNNDINETVALKTKYMSSNVEFVHERYGFAKAWLKIEKSIIYWVSYAKKEGSFSLVPAKYFSIRNQKSLITILTCFKWRSVELFLSASADDHFHSHNDNINQFVFFLKFSQNNIFYL